MRQDGEEERRGALKRGGDKMQGKGRGGEEERSSKETRREERS